MSHSLRSVAEESLRSDPQEQLLDGGTSKSNERPIIKLLKIKAYKRLLLLVGMYTLPTSMLQVFLVPYGAAWFGGCDVNEQADEDTDCEWDYDEWILWDSASLTLMGAVSFLFSGFLGRASDSFGRKPFLLLTFVVGLLNRGFMIFSDNLWIFLGLRGLYGINGGRDAQTPVMNAYYADILPPDVKTLGFGLSYGMAGIMLFLGAGIATGISLLYRTDFNWVAIGMVYILAIIYCVLFVKESLLPQNRKKFSLKNFNPIRPLLHVADNKIVLWVSVIQFLISLPQGGIIGIILVYLADSMGIDDSREGSVINAIFLVSMGTSGIVCTGIVLPILKKRFGDLVIAEIGIYGSIVSQLTFASFVYVPQIPIIVFGGLLYFSVGISNAAIFSILTKYLSAKEQGQGFGIVQSYRAVTTIIAPFAFAVGYRRSKNDLDLPSLPFAVSAIIIASALIFTRFALKGQMEEYDRSQGGYRKKSTIDMLDEDEDEWGDDEAQYKQQGTSLTRLKDDGYNGYNGGGQNGHNGHGNEVSMEPATSYHGQHSMSKSMRM